MDIRACETWVVGFIRDTWEGDQRWAKQPVQGEEEAEAAPRRGFACPSAGRTTCVQSPHGHASGWEGSRVFSMI